MSPFDTNNTEANGSSTATRVATKAAMPQEVLAFRVGSEEYGVDILQVQEIRSYEQPTRMANAPDYFKGVINLRGVVVPILDMRIKFNLEQANYDSLTVVIVLNIAGAVVGVVVDSVSDVLELQPEQLRPVPAFSGMESDYLLAIGQVADRMLILLDMQALVSNLDQGLLIAQHAV